MERATVVIKVWTAVLNHLRSRDRGVKVLQYGCQMLLGFYGHKMKKEMFDALSLARRTASTSRKAFWMFKSLTHIGPVINLVEALLKQFSWVVLFDLLEQISLIAYYYYENLVFLVRVKFLNLTEDELDAYVNWSWFLGDVWCFLAAILRLCTSLVEYNRFNPGSTSTVCDDRQIARFYAVCNDTVASIIAFFEVAASAEYVDAWEFLIGKSVGDGWVGFFGVMSSTLIIADNAAKFWNEIQPAKKLLKQI